MGEEEGQDRSRGWGARAVDMFYKRVTEGISEIQETYTSGPYLNSSYM